MARRERDILEHAVHVVTEQAAKADDPVNGAIEVGRGIPQFVHRVAEV